MGVFFMNKLWKSGIFGFFLIIVMSLNVCANSFNFTQGSDTYIRLDDLEFKYGYGVSDIVLLYGNSLDKNFTDIGKDSRRYWVNIGRN